MNGTFRFFYAFAATMSVILAACSNSGNSLAPQSSLAPPLSSQGHAKKLVNSGVSLKIINAYGGAATFYTTQNCGENPFTPAGGSVSYGTPVNLTQTGDDCFLPPSYTYITVGPTRIAEDCSLNITQGAGSTFTFSIIDAGSDTQCSVSPTSGLSTTFTWDLK